MTPPDPVPPEVAGRPGATSRPSAFRFLLPLLGAFAGLAAWAGAETRRTEFRASARATARGYDFSEQLREQVAFDRRRAAVENGLLGLALGAVSGAAGGLAARSLRRALAAGAVGALAAGAAGAAVALPLVAFYRGQFDLETSTLLLPLAVHGGMWAVVGAAAGLAYGLGGGGGAVRPVAGGVAGALIGAAVFEAVYAVAYPLDAVGEVSPVARSARLVATVVAAVAIGSGVALAVSAARGVTR